MLDYRSSLDVCRSAIVVSHEAQAGCRPDNPTANTKYRPLKSLSRTRSQHFGGHSSTITEQVCPPQPILMSNRRPVPAAIVKTWQRRYPFVKSRSHWSCQVPLCSRPFLTARSITDLILGIDELWVDCTCRVLTVVENVDQLVVDCCISELLLLRHTQGQCQDRIPWNLLANAHNFIDFAVSRCCIASAITFSKYGSRGRHRTIGSISSFSANE